jgi:hypothetical protein
MLKNKCTGINQTNQVFFRQAADRPDAKNSN